MNRLSIVRTSAEQLKAFKTAKYILFIGFEVKITQFYSKMILF